MTFRVVWSDRLELLAERLFASLADQRGDPFRPRCVVVKHPLAAGWLKQFFLFSRRGRQRVLANWHFPLLHPFVNDWLAAMDGSSAGDREAAAHPFSRASMQWRIYSVLSRDLSGLAALAGYVGPGDAAGSGIRRFSLAGRLARLFDDYQNYRPDLLLDWQRGNCSGLSEDSRWQAVLWRRLAATGERSYLSMFLDLDEKLADCGLDRRYDQVALFGLTSMPPPYMHFFATLGKFMDVTFYLFNPCADNWFEDQSSRRRELSSIGALVGAASGPPSPDAGNPLLAGLAMGCQPFLAELLDRTEGRAEEDSLFGCFPPASLLKHVQHHIRCRVTLPLAQKPAIDDGDHSIQVHVCHSPLREVEVMRDQLLAWFAADSSRQPREVQVLAADLETYAPYIESVLSTGSPDGKAMFPWRIDSSRGAGPGSVAESLPAILRLPGGRFSAPEMMDLLEVAPVRRTFSISREDLPGLRRLARAAGIRWGIDRDHVSQVSGGGEAAADGATWRRGLDRMLLGYAMGRLPAEEPLAGAGCLGVMRPLDEIEGGWARLAGALGLFFAELRDVAGLLAGEHPAGKWPALVKMVISRLYRCENDNYREMIPLHRAVRRLEQTVDAAGGERISAELVAAFIEAQLEPGLEPLIPAANAVLFTPLATTMPSPRKLIYLLGLSDGVFPRADERPAFDLMATSHRRGDPSLRMEDRLAFLESLMCARKNFYLSYVGRGAREGEVIPPSTVVAELQSYIRRVFDLPAGGLETVHRLQSFHPEYFVSGGKLFSYSSTDLEAARAMRNRLAPGEPRAPGRSPPSGKVERVEPSEALALNVKDLSDLFRNPALAYFRRMLKARIEVPSDLVIPETELFEPAGLERYQRDDCIFRCLLAGGAVAQLPEVLGEMGLAPLAGPGRAGIMDTVEKIGGYLDLPCRGVGVPLRRLYREQERGRDETRRIAIGRTVVQGPVRTFALDGQPAQMFARYASIKPSDLVRAWICHLFANASGGDRVVTIVAGRKSDRPDCLTISGLDRESASGRLREMLSWMPETALSVAPFAPATSHAYALAAGGGDSVADDALGKAREAWQGNQVVRGEVLDPYLRAVWGESGPFAHSSFAQVAIAFWQPFQEAVEALAGIASAGTGGASHD